MITARRFFEDAHGRIVLWQWPNLPLWIWVAASVGTRVLSGTPRDVASLVAFGALFTWAWLELSAGVSPFRRSLGAVVLVSAVASRIL